MEPKITAVPATERQKLSLGHALDDLFLPERSDTDFANAFVTFLAAITGARGVAAYRTITDATPLFSVGEAIENEKSLKVATAASTAQTLVFQDRRFFGLQAYTGQASSILLCVDMGNAKDVALSLAHERLELLIRMSKLRAIRAPAEPIAPVLDAAIPVARGDWSKAQALVDRIAQLAPGKSFVLAHLKSGRVSELVANGQETVAKRAILRTEVGEKIERAFREPELEQNVWLLGKSKRSHALVTPSEFPHPTLKHAISAVFATADRRVGNARTKLMKFLSRAAILTAIVAAGFVPVGDSISVPAVVRPTAERIVTAPFDGRLAEINVAEGDRVEAASTILATMDTSRLEIDRAEIQESLTTALAKAEQARSERRAADLKFANLDVERARLQLESIEIQLRDAQMQAPISGVVQAEELTTRKSSFIGLGTEIMRIVDPERLRIDMTITPRARARLSEDASGTFRADAIPDYPVPVDIAFLGSARLQNDDLTTFLARSDDLSSEVGRLQPGMEGAVRFEFERIPLGVLIWTRFRDWALITFWI